MNGSCCAYRGKCIFLTLGKDTKYKICIYWDYDAITKIGQLPRVSGEDPERIRVDSVFETSVCLFFDCLSVSKFSQF